MSKSTAALRRLSRAKATVRRCKKAGRPPPDAPPLFDRPAQEQAQIRALATRCDYAEPWASYLAPYLYDAKEHHP